MDPKASRLPAAWRVAPVLIKRWQLGAWALAIAIALVGCGGGGGGGGGAVPAGPPQVIETPPSTAEASRFLGQATFGAQETSINQLMQAGYRPWMAQQFAQPQALHRHYMDRIQATLPAGDNVGQNEVFESFWQQAAVGPDALRQRVAFALSQIFVVSMQDSEVANHPRGVASYLDMLGTHAFGNYRELLEAVTLHPMMGIYLSHLRNQREDPQRGRVPDENYAREVMQLFSIGLFELNPDGSVRTTGNGRPFETYTNDDISGLARVFTGFSWYAGPNAADRTDSRFFGGNANPERDWRPMQGYPRYHSNSAKTFLGTTIAQQSANDPNGPEASLRVALDRLFNHPNVGPFIGRQLIQRLVTSNPSPAYIARVSAAFANNGAGVRGDMRAVLTAILLDPEARLTNAAALVTDTRSGRVREPVLRLANWMRAFNASSATGRFQVWNTDDPQFALSQTPLRSPSVFNFYRPGYVVPNGSTAAANLVAPELQIAHETSVAGYTNFINGVIDRGVGNSVNNRRDVQPQLSAELALADRPDALVDRLNLLLAGGQLPAATRSTVRDAVASIPLRSVAAQNATDRANRVKVATLLVMASPDYVVAK